MTTNLATFSALSEKNLVTDTSWQMYKDPEHEIVHKDFSIQNEFFRILFLQYIFQLSQFRENVLLLQHYF